MADLSVFSDSYLEARGKFIDAARGAGATVYEYRHPTLKGPDGEPLCLDMAVAGPENAERVLVAGSGTHGIEGYSGSAAQSAWLASGGIRRLPKRTAMVFFHAHNPWGFAHKARGTEENVDLNRNFVDHGNPYPANPGYAEVHPIVTPAEWNDASIAGIFRGLDAYRQKVGEKPFSTAFNGGQYSHADGIYFGGQREQWANYAFREAVVKHVAHAKHASIIDLHTGIGPWMEHIYLCFHKEGSPARERARAWWGERAVNLAGVTHKALADLPGRADRRFRCSDAQGAGHLDRGGVRHPQARRGAARQHGRALAALPRGEVPGARAQGACRILRGVLSERSAVARRRARAVEGDLRAGDQGDR